MIEPIAYAVETYFTERRGEFERYGTVVYHAPMGMATMPLYSAAAISRRSPSPAGVTEAAVEAAVALEPVPVRAKLINDAAWRAACNTVHDGYPLWMWVGECPETLLKVQAFVSAYALSDDAKDKQIAALGAQRDVALRLLKMSRRATALGEMELRALKAEAELAHIKAWNIDAASNAELAAAIRARHYPGPPAMITREEPQTKAQTVTAEPVAWRYQHLHPTEDELLRGHSWHFAFNDVRKLAEDLGVDLGAVEPLYTSEALAQAHADGKAEGMRDAAATHRHKKRGSEYVLIGYGKMQAEKWFAGDKSGTDSGGNFHALSVDMREVAIYRSVDDGSLWVRPREEFEDGRFEALPSPADEGGTKP